MSDESKRFKINGHFHKPTFAHQVGAMADFTPEKVVFEEEEIEVDPKLSIPESMDALDVIQDTIERICKAHEIIDRDGYGQERLMSVPITSWLDSVRERLATEFGKSMLDVERFADDNGIDLTREGGTGQ